MNTKTDFLPWAMPNETIEAIEIMMEAAEEIRNTAKFASLRKELRIKLLNHASKLETMAKLISGGIIDESLMIALDAMSNEKKTVGGQMGEIMEAIENHVTAHHRRKQ